MTSAGYHRVPLLEEEPPDYNSHAANAKWSNSIPLVDIESRAGNTDNVQTEVAVLREVRIGERSGPGFGFQLGSSRPCVIHSVDANCLDLKIGDQLMELNGEDVTELSLVEVQRRLSASNSINMLIMPGPPPTEDVNDDLSPPNNNLPLALCSVALCPCLGVFSVYHASRVNIAFSAGLVDLSRA